MIELSPKNFGKTKMYCIKLLYDKLSARNFQNNVNAVQVCVNKFTELGKLYTQVVP